MDEWESLGLADGWGISEEDVGESEGEGRSEVVEVMEEEMTGSRVSRTV